MTTVRLSQSIKCRGDLKLYEKRANRTIFSSAVVVYVHKARVRISLRRLFPGYRLLVFVETSANQDVWNENRVHDQRLKY
jgi:transcription antitermination factor NusG